MLQNTLLEVVPELFGNNLQSKCEYLNREAEMRYLLTTVFQIQMEQQWGLGQIFNSRLQKLPRFISLQHRVLWDVLAESRTCGVAAALAALSQERNCLSALALQCSQPCPSRLWKGCTLWAPAGAGSSTAGHRHLLWHLHGASGTGGFVCGRGYSLFCKGNVLYWELQVGSILLSNVIVVILMNFSVKYKKTEIKT